MSLVIYFNEIKSKKKRKFFKSIIQLLFYCCKYFLLYFIFNFLCVHAFNIDTKHPQIHKRLNTGFGYSVDFAYTTEKRDKYT